MDKIDLKLIKINFFSKSSHLCYITYKQYHGLTLHRKVCAIFYAGTAVGGTMLGRRDYGIGINVKTLSLAVLTPNVPRTLSKHQ